MNRLKNSLVSFLHYIKSCPRSILHLIRNRNLWSKKETYYPEAKYHKSSFCIFCEQLLCILKYGEINDFYFLYGFDTKNRKQCNEYIQHSEFRAIRNKKNYTQFNWVNVLRDKELFAIVGESYGIPTIKTIGILKNNTVYVKDGSEFNIIQYLSKNSNLHLFFKPQNDECGKGIFSIDIINNKFFMSDKETTLSDIKNYIETLNDKEYIIQNKLVQHEDMNILYSKSLNTMRIITIKDKKGIPLHFGSLLRIGANGSIVDNLAKGGIAIGINTEGILKSYGFLKPPHGKMVTKHPNTNVQFDGFVIPYYKESVNMCLFFHRKIKDVFAIGWDIAITEDGPIFVEGNDNFEISGIQACNKGMKKEIITLLK